MQKLFDFLDGFKLDEKPFIDELDKLYHTSFIKGQDSALNFLRKHFPDEYEFDIKDTLKVKNELDTYVADRTTMNMAQTDYKESTEKNGYLSGYIQILNECYIYLLRYSSIIAAKKAEESTDKK